MPGLSTCWWGQKAELRTFQSLCQPSSSWITAYSCFPSGPQWAEVNISEFLLWHKVIGSVSRALGRRFNSLAWHSGLSHSCSVDYNSGLDLIPGPGTPYAMGWPKKRKEKKKPTFLRGSLHWSRAEPPPGGAERGLSLLLLQAVLLRGFPTSTQICLHSLHPQCWAVGGGAVGGIQGWRDRPKISRPWRFCRLGPGPPQ